MLVLGSRLLSMPVMSLQTGTKLAEANLPLIDPSNLKILAYNVSGPLLGNKKTLLLVSDIRELGKLGMIIDSSDEFVELDDVVAIKKVSDLNFKLIGMAVIDETKRKLGKLEDYSVDTDSFVIQQLHVKRGLLKSLSETELLIHRSQIVEINDTQIIVRTTAKKLAATPAKPNQLSYINPFRSPAPQTDNRN
ncbi:MAG TPA: PRC-barrel domain-containing protein [Candidatus Saccharibacteria bacterium]|nr:PRC-barrel domain-containing protein [Candidatus Saccharibacteria bacterium]HRQ07256.1 PRC-barrel domain-containing protein [Candidatus Saccharibacteria bacterium]